MSESFQLTLFAIAFGASTLGGMLGMAGGIFVVPALVLFLHVDIHVAVAASLVSVIACSCASAAPFVEARLTNMRLAIVLEVATTLGALSGVVLAGILAPRVLFGVFAVVLAASAWQMRARRETSTAPAALPSRRWAQLGGTYASDDGAELGYAVDRLPLGLGLMYGAGLVSALLGIGSGVLKIPAMDTALRLPLKVSSATSSFMIGVTAAASAVAYFVRGDIAPGIAAPIAVGSVLGSVLGAKLMLGARTARLRYLFVATLVALCMQMLLAACGIDLVGGR